MIVLANFFATYFPKWFSHHMLDSIRHLKSPEQTKWVSKFLLVQFESMFAEDTLSSNLSSSLSFAIIAKDHKLVEHETLRKLLEYNPDKISSIAKTFFKIYLVLYRRKILLSRRWDLKLQLSRLKANDGSKTEISALKAELDKIALILKDEPKMEFTQKTQAT